MSAFSTAKPLRAFLAYWTTLGSRMNYLPDFFEVFRDVDFAAFFVIGYCSHWDNGSLLGC